MKRLGVVTALAAEARAFCPSLRRDRGKSDDAYCALRDGSLLAVSGIGYDAARAAARALQAAPVSALMSFGLAGGLDPKLVAGSIILPAEVIARDGARFAACRSWRARLEAALRPARRTAEGSLLCSAFALETPADKAAAFQASGAVAVDMESAAVAEIAAVHQLPFVAVRVIADTAEDALPRVAMAAIATGRVHIGDLLSGLLQKPGEIAALLRMSRRYHRAMRSLRAVAASAAWAPLESDTHRT